MKKENLIYGVVGFFAGLLIMGFTTVIAVNNDNHNFIRSMGINMDRFHHSDSINHTEMSMDDMANYLKGKTGDDFDKAFLEMMIAHHEGAVDMAELISAQAKHQELKDLGEAIVSAQTKEINDMQQWQEDWGYESDEVMQMMHGNH